MRTFGFYVANVSNEARATLPAHCWTCRTMQDCSTWLLSTRPGKAVGHADTTTASIATAMNGRMPPGNPTTTAFYLTDEWQVSRQACASTRARVGKRCTSRPTTSCADGKSGSHVRRRRFSPAQARFAHFDQTFNKGWTMGANLAVHGEIGPLCARHADVPPAEPEHVRQRVADCAAPTVTPVTADDGSGRDWLQVQQRLGTRLRDRVLYEVRQRRVHQQRPST